MAANTWDPGGQEVSQIVFNDGAATTVTGNLLGNPSIDTEPDVFDAAIGFPVRRPFVTKNGSIDVLDYSAVAALEGMMTDRDEVAVTVTYVDATTQAFSNAVLRVIPIVNQIPDACTLYVNAQGGGYNNLTSTFTNLGVILEGASFDFGFPFDGTDGCGRTYYGGTVRVDATFQLPGIRGATTDVYAAADAFFNTNVDVAIAMANGNFLILEDVYLFNNYGPETGNGPRTVEVQIVGTDSAWSNIVKYTDGAVTALTDAWGTTTNSVDPGDLLAGATVTWVATGQDEDDGAGGGVVDWTSA